MPVDAPPETERSLHDTLDHLIGMILRRKLQILFVTAVTVLADVVVLYQLPNRYTSEATLFVVEQQVPQRYVTPTSTTELVDALPAMTQEVLSRNRLLELADQFGLYAPQRSRLAPEEVDALMRQYISIEALPPTPSHRSSNAFKISFTAQKATLAQEVTSKLTSLFIQENLRTREDQARNTTSFLRERLEDARKKLVEQEGLLSDFKTKYLGELPEQRQGNLAILSGAQMQLHNISSSLGRAEQQRVYIESLLNGYRRLISRKDISGAPVAREFGRPISLYQIEQADLAALKSKREKLLVELRPLHPDVLSIGREIAAKEAVLAALNRDVHERSEVRAAVEGEASKDIARADLDEDSSITQLKSQLESNRIEIANLTKDERDQKAVIAEYQSRLNLTPVREQQLATILRDYELSKLDYADLLGKEQQSQLAMSLEKQQAGQHFRLVEPPSLPALPSSPKRLKMGLMGIAGGLFLGFTYGVILELRHPAFYSERQVNVHFSIPLVVGLPLLISSAERQRSRWRNVYEGMSGTVLFIAVLVAEVWVYRHP